MFNKENKMTTSSVLHIGTKLVLAIYLTRGEYNKHQGWDIPEDQNPDDEGYLVEYLDGGKPNHPDHKGYISWSPKDVFDNAYKTSGEMTFGMAVEAAKLGYKIARVGWNGSNMFAYIVKGNSYPAQSEVIKGLFPDDMVPYRDYWALKTAQNDVATWAPSGSDTLAEDWSIVD
jgi:hypothetical protein